MKITHAKVIVSCPGRSFVTLKVEASEGAYGVGDAMTAAFLSRHAQALSLTECLDNAAWCGALKAGLPGDFYPITHNQLRRWREEHAWR